MSIKDKAAIVGIGRTPYYRRGQSAPQTQMELACKAILAALDDAGLTVADIDGFAYFSSHPDTAILAQTLGVPDVKFTAAMTGGGGGSAGSIGLASAAIVAGMANVVVTVYALQQIGTQRRGAAFAPGQMGRTTRAADQDFYQSFAMVSPAQGFAIIARRHMELYGTTREQLGHIAINQRANASRRESALMRTPLTMEDYLAARMISYPLCLFDNALESDGAVAIITTTAERARDCRQRPVYVMGAAQGGLGRWGQAETWFNMPDEYFVSSGHRPIAQRVFEMAGVGPADIDVAEIYDNFSSNVILQLEDYGFCKTGEGGPFVASGATRWPDGGLPVNTHGGNLSEVFLAGSTHIYEGVEQMRGTAVNQVKDAAIALVTGGAAAIPTSAIILRR